MAAPWSEGDAPGEVAGPAQIRIVEEVLRFDLRPLAEDGRDGQVFVQYRLENSGAETHADLALVAPLARDVSIALDGKTADVRVDEDVPVPPVYVPPKLSPPFPGDAADGYQIEYPRVLVRDEDPRCDLARFMVVIPAGSSVLTASYTFSAPRRDIGDVYWAYQVAYVLSPARTWASFGTLAVEALLPPDWEGVASLPLERTPAGLSGRFLGIPADTLALTVRPPAPALAREAREWAPVAGAGLCVLLSLLVGIAAGRSVGRLPPQKRRPVRRALLLMLLVGIGVALVMVSFHSLGSLFVDKVHLTPRNSYSGAVSSLVLFPVALGLSLLAVLVTFRAYYKNTTTEPR
jgi:hypothetical protein